MSPRSFFLAFNKRLESAVTHLIEWFLTRSAAFDIDFDRAFMAHTSSPDRSVDGFPLGGPLVVGGVSEQQLASTTIDDDETKHKARWVWFWVI